MTSLPPPGGPTPADPAAAAAAFFGGIVDVVKKGAAAVTPAARSAESDGLLSQWNQYSSSSGGERGRGRVGRVPPGARLAVFFRCAPPN